MLAPVHPMRGNSRESPARQWGITVRQVLQPAPLARRGQLLSGRHIDDEMAKVPPCLGIPKQRINRLFVGRHIEGAETLQGSQYGRPCEKPVLPLPRIVCQRLTTEKILGLEVIQPSLVAESHQAVLSHYDSGRHCSPDGLRGLDLVGICWAPQRLALGHVGS
ncbi:hypothetical protein D3C87_1222570 [compost metagenome]